MLSSLAARNEEELDAVPKAVGIVWRRLAGNITCYNVREKLVEKLKLSQLGFSVEGGGSCCMYFLYFGSC